VIESSLKNKRPQDHTVLSKSVSRCREKWVV
jgi:hypothetical protein